MTKPFFKHKILLDENFPTRSYLPLLNSRFTVKHIAKDLKHGGWSDEEVYQCAKDNKLIVVTFNFKDFIPFIDVSDNAGIVGVSNNLPNEVIDKKLTALFRKATQKSLLGKLTTITGETEN